MIAEAASELGLGKAALLSQLVNKLAYFLISIAHKQINYTVFGIRRKLE